MTKLILFNGPPRSGKDTSALRTLSLGQAVGSKIQFDRFAMPIKRAFAGMANAEIDQYGNCEPFESTKSDLIPWLGCTYRQWQIDFSERFLKPYGEDIFGRLFVQRNAGTDAEAIVVPDSGFAIEVGPIVEHFGMENVVLFRVHRPGYDFTGDSRSYLPDGVVDTTIDIQNDSTVEKLHEKVDFYLTTLVG